GIVLARDFAAIGIGAGQMNRVEAARIAVRRAGDRAGGAVMASDASFPYPDRVAACLEAGVTAVIQPGGPVRDAEAVAAADAPGPMSDSRRPRAGAGGGRSRAARVAKVTSVSRSARANGRSRRRLRPSVPTAWPATTSGQTIQCLLPVRLTSSAAAGLIRSLV